MEDSEPGTLTGSAIQGIKRGLKWGPVVFVGVILYRYFRRFWYALNINRWLKEESDHIVDSTRRVDFLGFVFEVHLTESEEPEMKVENMNLSAPIVITAEREIDPAVRGAALDRGDLQHLEDELDWILTDAPGIYGFLDNTGESCRFTDAESVAIEYRIYPDGLSQHELLNSIMEIANALKFIRNREEKYKERLGENR